MSEMLGSEYERIVGDMERLAERLREAAEEEGSQRVYDLAEELLERLVELRSLH